MAEQGIRTVGCHEMVVYSTINIFEKYAVTAPGLYYVMPSVISLGYFSYFDGVDWMGEFEDDEYALTGEMT